MTVPDYWHYTPLTLFSMNNNKQTTHPKDENTLPTKESETKTQNPPMPEKPKSPQSR